MFEKYTVFSQFCWAATVFIQTSSQRGRIRKLNRITERWRRRAHLKNSREVNCWLGRDLCVVQTLRGNTADPWLRAGEGEQVHVAKVIGGGQQGSVVWPAHRVDVCAVRSVRPDSCRRSSQRKGWWRQESRPETRPQQQNWTGLYLQSLRVRHQKSNNLPKVLKLRVQVEVAHCSLRTMSMLVTCLPLDASPRKKVLSCLGLI